MVEKTGKHWAQGAALLEENEERLCVICLVNERDTTVLPCRRAASLSTPGHWLL